MKEVGQADDDYVRQLAGLLRRELPATTRLYVEYSNEVWNAQFAQHAQNREMAIEEDRGHPASPLAHDGSDAPPLWALRRIGQRGVQISNLFREIFGEAATLERLLDMVMVAALGLAAIALWTAAGAAAFAWLRGRLEAARSMLGLVASNGPGTISAQGAKGAVSADGPEAPERVQINKAYAGFLTHTGYAHGGNGFEAMRFLIGRFRDLSLPDPGDPDHGLDLSAIAAAYAKEYKVYKGEAKAAGNLSYEKIPCVNHPVFKGKDVNFDPREVYVRELFEKRSSYNVFHDFYHHLVKALASYGKAEEVRNTDDTVLRPKEQNAQLSDAQNVQEDNTIHHVTVGLVVRYEHFNITISASHH